MSTAFEWIEPEPLGDEGIIPLHGGDHLDRETFHARYAAMPPGIKAELIGGVVYMPSPVLREHAGPTFKLALWLGTYEAATPGTQGFDNATVILSGASEPQPDLCLLVRPEYGGQTHVTEEGYIGGGPEFAVEVALSSASYDLHSKRVVYAQAGVREYLIFLPHSGRIFWLVNRGRGDFERLQPGEDGLYRSEVFPGLWLDPEALLRMDSAAILETLNRGLATEEHAAFVQRLALTKTERSAGE